MTRVGAQAVRDVVQALTTMIAAVVIAAGRPSEANLAFAIALFMAASERRS